MGEELSLLEQAKVNVPEVHGKSLEQLIETFSPGQRRYLVMLAIGDDRFRALKDGEVTATSVEVWRSKVPGFKEMEYFLLESNGKYADEAIGCYTKSIQMKHLLFLDQMTSKGVDWVFGKEVDREDKKYIMQCEMMINKLMPARQGGHEEGGSYERMLIERRVSNG